MDFVNWLTSTHCLYLSLEYFPLKTTYVCYDTEIIKMPSRNVKFCLLRSFFVYIWFETILHMGVSAMFRVNALWSLWLHNLTFPILWVVHLPAQDIVLNISLSSAKHVDESVIRNPLSNTFRKISQLVLLSLDYT